MRSDCPQVSERTGGVAICPPAAQGPWSRCWRSSWSSQLASPSRTESSTSGSWSPSLRGTCGPPGRASAPPPRPRWSWWGWAGPRLTVCHCVGCGGAGARSGHCAGLRTEHSPHWHWPRPGWAAAHGTARRSNLPLATVNWGVRRPQHWCSMKNEASGLEYKYYIACYITDWVERKNVVHGGGGIAPKFVLLSIYYKQ